jgi:hypothetical protein
MPLGEVNNVYIVDGEVNGVHLGAGGAAGPPNLCLRNGAGTALSYAVWLTLPRDPVSRAATAAEVRAGFPARGGGRERIAARAALARLLWNENGARKIPSAAALDRAISALPRGELEWICEFNLCGPIYLIPTRPFLRALAKRIRSVGARRVLDVAAGDGHLAASLAREAPDLEIIASDSGAWERPAARMNARERRSSKRADIAGLVPGPRVLRLEARAAIRKVRPDLVLAAWLPPGPLLSRVLRSGARWVLEIGAGSGVTGDIRCWRFEHEFCEELDELGRCRLDGRKLHTRATLYGPL